jgi:hypothetical protein
MKFLLKLLFIIIFPFFSFSQNLVPNGNFEQYSGCPGNTGHLDSALFWINPNAFATPDYLNECSSGAYPGVFGYQLPHSGIAYIALFLGNPTSNSREYAEVPLNSTLVSGKCYHLEFFASAAHLNYSTDALHAYFSDTLIIGVPVNNLFQFTPQIINTPGNFMDTLNWTLISGDFMAMGGESYLILGNFFNFSNTSYLQIDTDPCCNQAYAYIDDVSLVEMPCTGLNEISLTQVAVFPNPVHEVLNITLNDYSDSEIQIFNSLTQLVVQKHFSHNTSVNLNQLNAGIYFYIIHNKTGKLKGGKFIIQ